MYAQVNDFIYRENDVLLGKKIVFPPNTGAGWQINELSVTIKTTATVGNRVIKAIVYDATDTPTHTYTANHNALVASSTFNIQFVKGATDRHLDNTWEIEGESAVIHLEDEEYLMVLDTASPVKDAADTMDISIKAFRVPTDAV